MDKDADIRYLMNSIETAEIRYIAPALGYAFYDDFITRKNVIVTSLNQATLLANINTSLVANGSNPITLGQLPLGIMVNAIEFCPDNYKRLWNYYLWKVCAEATDLLSIVPSWLRTTAQGQTYNNPKTLTSEQLGTASGEKADVEYKIDAMSNQRVLPLLAAMKKWIEDQGTYPLFPSNKCKNDGLNKRPGGLIFGAYEDENPNGPNMWGSRSRGRSSNCDNGATPGNNPVLPPAVPAKTTRSITVFIKDVPDETLLLEVGNGLKIYLEYAPGDTIQIMVATEDNTDYAYLIGKRIIVPVYRNDYLYTQMPYNPTTGTFDNAANGGFVWDAQSGTGDSFTVNIEDYV